jgi:sugar phosphate isomerase/epimerase
LGPGTESGVAENIVTGECQQATDRDGVERSRSTAEGLRGSKVMKPLFSLDSSLSSRREFLYSISALALLQTVKPAAPALKTYGIAYTSFPIRMRQAAQAAEQGAGPAIPAEKFIDLCKSFGGDGCQMAFSQLVSTDEDYLKRIRRAAEDKGMFLELSLSGQVLEDPAEFARVASVAQQLGVTRARVAINGRRYEEFFEMKKWKDFAARWQQVLLQAEPTLRQHKLSIGIENHKEWLADELATMLKKASSPYLGACVDFGNNLALLEDSVEVAEKLAPYAVTTHLKDMAVAPSEEGFLLSEVPLGQGILPLTKIMEVLRRSRSDIHFCLEMITRDPLKVPYLDDKYWVTYDKRDNAKIEKFKATILSKASASPLPKISGMSSQRMLAVEDDNLRRCVAYAKRTLGL